jgi:molybdopterin-guanine dinucleotide biosynthesis protein A
MAAFEGFILAGGKSSRMRRDKRFLRLGEKTFVERAVAALAPIATKISLVVAAASSNRDFEFEKTFPARVVADVFPNCGALGAIHAALFHAETEWAALLACDLPFASGELFERLAKIARGAPRATAAIVPIQPDGRLQPLCALYRAGLCLNAATKLLEENQKSPPAARRLIEAVAAQCIEFSEIADLPDAERFFINVNTPEEFEIARKINR